MLMNERWCHLRTLPYLVPESEGSVETHSAINYYHAAVLIILYINIKFPLYINFKSLATSLLSLQIKMKRQHTKQPIDGFIRSGLVFAPARL
jgi:hypothetical protein